MRELRGAAPSFRIQIGRFEYQRDTWWLGGHWGATDGKTGVAGCKTPWGARRALRRHLKEHRLVPPHE